MKKQTILILVAVLIIITACGNASNSNSNAKGSIELTISAASSMMDVLTEIKENFEKENPNMEVTFNFGGTGALRKQVEQGAPIDVFFSASKKDYDLLLEGGYIEQGEELLHNQLVAIQPQGGPVSTLQNVVNTNQKFALGTPESVPAGFYAQEALQKMGFWDELQGRMVFAKDVSHVLQLVKDKAVSAGIVYSSDLHRVNEVDMIEKIDGALHTPISYYVAVIENGNERSQEKQAAAEQFYNYAQNETSKALFEVYGFVIRDKLVEDT
ncbi:molybdate ABC transporter substrate-binding protein [Virgibacillus dokdonensis]|uniref:Molybdate ABC transporter substrate-binding protein n=1 Tax=Virgibacillus dokdonensis TaxID=302167 RepID=A0A3E0WWB9_9BACI|nr:molybdate ABC transporter substrate-binding protein [Virgibacillus dokdonensis]RFA36295.1 molybdate ABC transporter substrate-binding protein [Virgibacillus dokdonensis]